jgi:hypothetical protein
MQTVINALDRIVNPPPPPETQIVYVSGDEFGSPNIGDSNFNPGYWLDKPIFGR